MKKLLPINLICLIVFQSSMLFGMKGNNSNGMIEGSICLINSTAMSMCYPSFQDPLFGILKGQQKKHLELLLNTKLIDNDPLVAVRVFSDGCYDLCNTDLFLKTHSKYEEYLKIVEKQKKLGCCNGELEKNEISIIDDVEDNARFPRYLPLSFIYRKKENDILELQVFGQLVRLKCTTQYYHDDLFHVALEKRQEVFEKNPRWLMGDEKILVKKGILVKKWWCIKKLLLDFIGCDSPGFYMHGPNSFPFCKKYKQNACYIRWFKWWFILLTSWFNNNLIVR